MVSLADNMQIDDTNEMFGLAVELVNLTSKKVFLTGKAGTGKTTFLKYIREKCPKQMAVIAPTGVAAINAGGVTIHSFFQLPFAPFLPDVEPSGNSESTVGKHDLISRLRFTSEKRKVINQLELLIIDEVSMVRCDVIDAIDLILRHTRSKYHQPFGGVQVLFIGDLYQLPPVVRDQEWKLLSQSYEGPFFFNSQIIRKHPPLYIEFEHIYRQTDQHFIDVLNKVRNNQLDDAGVSLLDSRFQPAFHPEKEEYILLTTHNETARNINSAELEKLATVSHKYRAVVKGDFADSAFPADELLELKVGAQVMFLKNDSDRAKRFYNGKIGVVTFLDDERISVKCKDDDDEIDVEPEVWRNIRYSVDQKSQKLDEEELGSYSQYPLRLAWAITIHKSQGLTFEKAIVDAGQSFAAGQVYVALSRCRSLEGLVLRSRIRKNALLTDSRIVRFSNSVISSGQLKQELKDALLEAQEQLALNSFDCSKLAAIIREMHEYVLENSKAFNSETIPWLETVSEQIKQVDSTAIKFQHWLKSRFVVGVPPGEVDELRSRSIRAALHFIGQLNTIIDALRNSQAETDSLEHSKAFNDSARELFAQLTLQTHLLKDFDGRFNISEWYKRRNSFELPSFRINSYSASRESALNDSPHPELYRKLKTLRDGICRTNDMPVYMVASGATLNEMSRYLPRTLEDLKRISGFGDIKVKRFGDQFVQIVQEYCEEHALETLMAELETTSKSRKREPRKKTSKQKDTKRETLEMFQRGLTISEIAKERSLTMGTIESHLTYFISVGEMNIQSVISKEKIDHMQKVVEENEGLSLTSLKQILGEDFSFSEIRMMLVSITVSKRRIS